MAETWRERIVRARDHGGFAQEDRGLAAWWSTCAVAEQARRHHHAIRVRNGYPLDKALGRLGAAFLAAVLANDVARAEAALDQIEDRALELKRKIGGRASRRRGPGTSSPRRAPLPVAAEEPGTAVIDSMSEPIGSEQ